MAYGELLTLMLHAPLPYRGLENPPIVGMPTPEEAGRALALLAPAGQHGNAGVAGAESEPAAGGLGSAGSPGAAGLAEGEEELFIFDEEGLVLFDPEEGPRVARPLPAPRFYGRGGRNGDSGRPLPDPPGRAAGAAPSPLGAGGPGGLPLRELPAGRYLFMQWRPQDAEEAAEGIEWFAREAWWERAGGAGPWILRRVAEDGKLAVQVLRALS